MYIGAEDTAVFYAVCYRLDFGDDRQSACEIF